MRLLLVVLVALALSMGAAAQQNENQQQPDQNQSQKKQKPQKQTEPSKEKEKNPEQAVTKPTEPAAQPEQKAPDDKDKEKEKKEEHYDMTEIAPVVTHHQATVAGKSLRYTATAGRLPIKRPDGKIEAEMFFVAYTLDGQEMSKRPLTFAFNGGPGSASIWLHMGA